MVNTAKLVRSKSTLARKVVPKLYFNHFNEKSVEGIATHDLFVKLGFLNNPRAGLVNWLPIGLSVLGKLRNVVNSRLQEVGAQEVSMSILSHSSLWEKTGRWSGTELFKLKDSNNQDFCLSPTSEEEITQLVKTNINSYKDLPITYYQIHEKFRDEKRPRMGLLRSREFLMKDAYSFDISEEAAMKSYHEMVGVYHNIFRDLKVPYVKAVADSGDIGGSLSHEWHYLHPTGEDTVFTCSSCGNVSNVEKTMSIPQQADETIAAKELFVDVDGKQYKVIYPANRSFDLNLLKAVYPNVKLIEPVEDIVDVITDSRLKSEGIPVVSAEEGEVCYSCKSGTLGKQRAIEVGHTFYLGTKYSKPLELTIPVPQENGKLSEEEVVMGCYGIGLSRIVASIGQISRDESGFKWPAIISPWNVTVVETKSLKEDASDIYQLLNKHKLDYRVDDRPKEPLNKKINQSNMIGIPLLLIIGNKYPIVEIEVRGKRYHETWKEIREQEDSFQWDVEEKNGIEKHLVHKDGLILALTALLSDM